MAVYASVVSLMNTIEQMMSHPRISTSFHNDQIQSLRRKTDLLLDFVEGGYDNYGGISVEAEDLESLIASAAHTAEDMIESHIVNQILPLSADEDRETSLSFSLYLQKKMAIEEKNVVDAREKAFSFSNSVRKNMTGLKKKIRSVYRKKSSQASLSCSQ